MTESQYKYLDVQMLSPCRFPGWSSGSVRTVIPLTPLWPPTPTLSTSSHTGPLSSYLKPSGKMEID